MHNIGYLGGHTLYELGPASDALAFFNCLDDLIAPRDRNTDYTLLADRLRVRCIRYEELDNAYDLMEKMKRVCADVLTGDVKWDELGVDVSSTRLHLNTATLAEVFSDYFEKFGKARESAELFYRDFNVYQPVRIVISDVPEFLVDKNRPLEQYENVLQESPFWLR